MHELAKSAEAGDLEIMACCQAVTEPLALSSNPDYNKLNEMMVILNDFKHKGRLKAIAAGKKALLDSSKKLSIFVGQYLTTE